MQNAVYEENATSPNIQEISKDFENINNSYEGQSPLNNNNIDEQKDNEENNETNFINIEENIFGGNMVLEQEHYMKQIDDDYQLLKHSINDDIDKQINYNIDNNNNIIDNNIIYNNNNSKLLKKRNQLVEYILGNNFSPPTPIKNINNDKKNNYSNPLSHSYSQKRKFPMENYPNIQSLQNDVKKDNYHDIKNKTINLDDYFNKDEEKNDYNGINPKDAIKEKEAQDVIEQDYESIFKDLKDAHKYTKKYSKKDDDDIFENSTTSFYSNNTNKNENKDNYKSQQRYYTKYNTSHFNSSAGYSNYDKNENKNKNINEINKEKNSENEAFDENSIRTTGVKNISKTVLDKVLINIQENKEDEEDEEDDEQNQKNKQEKNIENKENDNENKEEEPQHENENGNENQNERNNNNNDDKNEEEEYEEEEEEEFEEGQ